MIDLSIAELLTVRRPPELLMINLPVTGDLELAPYLDPSDDIILRVPCTGCLLRKRNYTPTLRGANEV